MGTNGYFGPWYPSVQYEPGVVLESMVPWQMKWPPREAYPDHYWPTLLPTK